MPPKHASEKLSFWQKYWTKFKSSLASEAAKKTAYLIIAGLCLLVYNYFSVRLLSNTDIDQKIENSQKVSAEQNKQIFLTFDAKISKLGEAQDKTNEKLDKVSENVAFIRGLLNSKNNSFQSFQPIVSNQIDAQKTISVGQN